MQPSAHLITAPAFGLTDIVDDLIRRHRATRPGQPPYVTSFPTLTDEDLLLALEGALGRENGPKVAPSHGTTIACTKCGRLNAPQYYLKRSHGRYAVLCFDNGQGCWERSGASNCTYIDQHMAQCPDLAEWVVAYGEDKLKERHVCSIHVAAVLTDVSEHRVYPLQD